MDNKQPINMHDFGELTEGSNFKKPYVFYATTLHAALSLYSHYFQTMMDDAQDVNHKLKIASIQIIPPIAGLYAVNWESQNFSVVVFVENDPMASMLKIAKNATVESFQVIQEQKAMQENCNHEWEEHPTAVGAMWCPKCKQFLD